MGSHSSRLETCIPAGGYRLWEFYPEPPAPSSCQEGPLSYDELLLLNIVQFRDGIDMTALCQGRFAGPCRLYLTLTPDLIAQWPRGKIESSIFNVVSPEAKKFIKKYHHALIGAGLSEKACSAFESLSRRGLLKTRPISWIAAA
jgi:hypothetical protein